MHTQIEKCSSCKNYNSILKIDENRFYWSEQLSVRNVLLHKKIIDLENYIMILEQKLANLHQTCWIKQLQQMSLEVQNCGSKLGGSVQKFPSTECSNLDATDNILVKVDNSVTRLNDAIAIFETEKEKYEALHFERENTFHENVNFLHEMIECYRENLYKEMSRYNELVLHIHNKLRLVDEKAQNYIKCNLEIKGRDISEELNDRYKNYIKHGNEQIKRQEILIKKMQVHRRELYSLLREERRKESKLKEKYENEIYWLKTLNGKLKLKNEGLLTRLRLNK